MSLALLLLPESEKSLEMDSQTCKTIAYLNIASAVTSALTIVLAIWSRFWRSSAHVDGLRCRAVMAMGISTACYSISQLSLMSYSKEETASMSVRISMFIATFSVVMNALLVACSVGLDAAVRYGLRSFGLARRLSNYYEVGCFAIALLVSHPILYLFNSVLWTGSAIVVEAKSRAAFDAAAWMIEYNSKYPRTCLRITVLHRGVCGLVSVEGAVSRNWVTIDLATAHVIDMRLVACRIHAETISHKSGHVLAEYQLTNRNFVRLSDSKTSIWHKSADAAAVIKVDGSRTSANGHATTAQNMDGWVEKIDRCHLQSSISHCENDGYSVSDISFESGLAEHGAGPMVLYPLTK
ncbi:hypothetical protein GGF39_002782 [Coemansia sp. RSA 1721]|nr:hypothetical protein GGF39_002782 [Coemansia sp. RSA 1721]